jgi:hypothetical protein
MYVCMYVCMYAETVKCMIACTAIASSIVISVCRFYFRAGHFITSGTELLNEEVLVAESGIKVY